MRRGRRGSRKKEKRVWIRLIKKGYK